MNITTKQTDRQRGRKVAAVLAGGLVRGGGSMATLASWNDSEYATATFTAGYVNLEGAVDSAQSSFSEHASPGSAGALSFSTPVSNLTPGDVVVAPFALHLGAGTTNNATVTLAAATSTGDVSNLTYELLKTSAAGCTASTTGTTVVASGTAVTSVSGASAVSLTKGATSSTAGAPAYLCFKVTAGSGLQQSQTGTVTWQFQAVSQ